MLSIFTTPLSHLQQYTMPQNFQPTTSALQSPPSETNRLHLTHLLSPWLPLPHPLHLTQNILFKLEFSRIRFPTLRINHLHTPQLHSSTLYRFHVHSTILCHPCTFLPHPLTRLYHQCCNWSCASALHLWKSLTSPHHSQDLAISLLLFWFFLCSPASFNSISFTTSLSTIRFLSTRRCMIRYTASLTSQQTHIQHSSIRFVINTKFMSAISISILS